MASASVESTNVLCGQCHKGKGTFKCQGCDRVFCFKHAADHRNELSKEFEEITGLCNLFQQTMTQQLENPRLHPSFEQIDQWEKQSISEIRRQAQEKRESLLRRLKKRTAGIQERFKAVSDQIRGAREENDFLEHDLKLWRKKLDQLNAEISSSSARSETSDLFHRVLGNSKIANNGQMIAKDSSSEHEDVRGANEYASGQHDLRFRVEKLSPSGWICFGIVTKSEVLTTNSYISPSSYGWSNKQQIYTAGTHASGQTSEIIEGDLIVLSIDCEQRKIALENERTNSTVEMSVDLSKCPFPWQFHLNLHQAGTCVRILHSDELN